MKRIQGWEFAFASEIARAKSRVFKFGDFDCGLFVCDCVKAMTGVDMAEGLRGYTDLKGAIRAIEFNMEQTAVRLATKYGLREIHPLTSSRGDVVYLATGELAIVGLDPRVALGASGTGLAVIPRQQWARAWRIS